ncbi:MAG: DUF2029 domain-containing protein [Candidatus Omnitrophica bacterium]|nr:DUF2029 domain-containing protein [Candidatus Omnitrophota bacterium]
MNQTNLTRMSRKGYFLFVIYGSIVLLGFYSYDLYKSAKNAEIYDFGTFYLSGYFLSVVENPYQHSNPLSAKMQIGAYNLNPPIFLFFSEFLYQFELVPIYVCWQIFSFLCFSLSIFILLKFFAWNDINKFILVMWSFAFAGFYQVLYNGQMQAFLLLLYCLFLWSLVKTKKTIIPSLLLGFLVAVKPFFGLILVFLFAGGYRRIAVQSLIAFSFFCLLPLLRYDFNVYQQWRASIGESFVYDDLSNNSLLAFFTRLHLLWLGKIMAGFIVLSAILAFYRGKFNAVKLCNISFVIILLASPISWTTYTLFLLPIFYLERWTIYHYIASLVFLVPVQLVFGLSNISYYHAVIFGSFHLFGIVLLFIPYIKDFISVLKAWRRPILDG